MQYSPALYNFTVPSFSTLLKLLRETFHETLMNIITIQTTPMGSLLIHKSLLLL